MAFCMLHAEIINTGAEKSYGFVCAGPGFTMTQGLKSKVAILTGAARGIGRAIALRLAKDGAAVIVNYSGIPAVYNCP